MTKLRLKREIKEKLVNVAFYGICLLGIVGCIWLLNLQDQHERERAIKRCGGENNIVERYTNQGDLYFTCKAEK